MFPLSAETRHRNSIGCSVDKLPDTCPVCGQGIAAIQKYAFCFSEPQLSRCLEVIFLCPKDRCQSLFIVRYKAINSNADQTTFLFQQALPIQKTKREFDLKLNEVSPNFIKIYNQALAAEQEELTEIIGPAYRKALEFLIKDFLCKEKPSDAESIKKSLLGPCIENYLEDQKTKEIAKRAAWLGNDETHYLRVWENKDVQDLKKLIDMVIHVIVAKYEYEDLLADMPAK